MTRVNIPSLRQFLLDVFDDNEFEDFCSNYFTTVQKEFTLGMVFSQKIRLLLLHCREYEQWKSLLARLEADRPHIYPSYQAAITTPAADGSFVDDLDSYRPADRPRWFVNVPQPRPHFVGRAAVVEELVAQLTSEGAGQSLALATAGQGGVGKTALAVALAWDKRVLAHFSDGVLWAGLGTQPDLLTLLAEWGRALGQDLSGLVEVEQRRRVVQQLIGQKRLLLVLDDVWQLEAAQAMQCGGPFCRLLLTTRDNSIAARLAGAAGVQAVRPLADEAAVALLQQLAPEAWTADEAAVKQLAEAVGGLPLALELLGGYLAAPERNAFADLSQQAVAELAEPGRRLSLAQQRLGSGQIQTLPEMVALSLEGLPEVAAQAWLSLGAFAPKPATFTREAAEAVAQTDGGTLGLLIARHLLEKGEDQLALHQVLADVAWGMALEQEELSSFEELSSWAAQERHRAYYLGLVNEDRGDWRRIEAAYEQIQWAWARLPEEVVLDWIEGLQQHQKVRGLWTDCIIWSKHGLEIVEKTGQRETEGILLNRLGLLYDNLGQWQNALEHFTHALIIQQEAADWAKMMAALQNMAVVFYKLGRHQEALEYYEQVLSFYEAIHDKAGIAVVLNNIGAAHHQLGNIEKALEYFEKALPAREEIGDMEGAATTLNNIGSIYLHLGQPQTMLEYCEQAFNIYKDIGNKSRMANTLGNIAVAYRQLGQAQMALDYYKLAMPIYEEVRDKLGGAYIQVNIGLAHEHLEQRQKALGYYELALPILLEMGGDSYVEKTTRYNMAMIYRAEGQLEEAVAQLRRVIELDKQVQHPDLASDTAMLRQVEAELANS